MDPVYFLENCVCLIQYRDAIDFEFCQHHPLIDKEYMNQADIFIIDFKKVNFIDSAGIGNLVGLYRNLNSQGKSLCLINITPHIKRVLEISEIEHVFPIFNSLQDAKMHFKIHS